MPTTATVELNYVDRAAVNRANAEHRTCPLRLLLESRERRDLVDTAAIMEHHKYKGLPCNNGFVFSKDQVERPVHNA